MYTCTAAPTCLPAVARTPHSQIKEESPRLARDSKVLRVTMDNVYEVFAAPREATGLGGIHFRFMPDAAQVGHALSVRCDALVVHSVN